MIVFGGKIPEEEKTLAKTNVQVFIIQSPAFPGVNPNLILTQFVSFVEFFLVLKKYCKEFAISVSRGVSMTVFLNFQKIIRFAAAPIRL